MNLICSTAMVCGRPNCAISNWSQVELGRSAALHVRRAKNGKPSVHPLRGDEIRTLRELLAGNFRTGLASS